MFPISSVSSLCSHWHSPQDSSILLSASLPAKCSVQSSACLPSLCLHLQTRKCFSSDCSEEAFGTSKDEMSFIAITYVIIYIICIFLLLYIAICTKIAAIHLNWNSSVERRLRVSSNFNFLQSLKSLKRLLLWFCYFNLLKVKLTEGKGRHINGGLDMSKFPPIYISGSGWLLGVKPEVFKHKKFNLYSALILQSFHHSS